MLRRSTRVVRSTVSGVTLTVVGVLAIPHRPATQEVELSGRVVDSDGAAVARARVAFEALDLPVLRARGRRGSYGQAHARQLAALRLPVTVTGRNGRWRVRLTPAQAALTTAGLRRFVVRIRADGFVTWQRAIGADLRRLNDAEPARLERPDPTRRLQIELRRGAAGRRSPADRAVRGWVLVERPFRFDGNRAVWLREVVSIDAAGGARFDAPPRVSGEHPAVRPTARAEAYRVTVFAVDCDTTTRMLAPGRHVVDLDPAPWQARRVLAARAAPAQGPIRATYQVAGRECTLDLEEPVVPMLGGEPPTRVTTGSGPVEVDTWDPDVPLFVIDAPKPQSRDEPGRAPAAETGDPDRSAGLSLAVLDRAERPVFGAAVWVEDGCVARAAADADVFALTDARGHATLSDLPRGTFHVLVQHPEHGAREGLIDFAGAADRRLTVRLRPGAADASSVGADAAGRPGALRVDLRELAARGAPCEVGVLQDDGTLVRRPFDETPDIALLEGLVAGPVHGYVRVGERAPVFFGGLMARPLDDPPIDAAGATTHQLVLRVVDADGAPVQGGVFLSLGERSGRGRPASAALLPLRPGDGDGLHRVSVRTFGAFWVRVHGPGDTAQDLQLAPAAAAGDGRPIEVALPAPKQPDGEGKDRGRGS